MQPGLPSRPISYCGVFVTLDRDFAALLLLAVADELQHQNRHANRYLRELAFDLRLGNDAGEKLLAAVKLELELLAKEHAS